MGFPAVLAIACLAMDGPRPLGSQPDAEVRNGHSAVSLTVPQNSEGTQNPEATPDNLELNASVSGPTPPFVAEVPVIRKHVGGAPVGETDRIDRINPL